MRYTVDSPTDSLKWSVTQVASCRLLHSGDSLAAANTAALGRSKSAKEELAYAVMTRWGLLGELKTTHEWNAIAVGDAIIWGAAALQPIPVVNFCM